jgi:hypothetical protein
MGGMGLLPHSLIAPAAHVASIACAGEEYLVRMLTVETHDIELNKPFIDKLGVTCYDNGIPITSGLALQKQLCGEVYAAIRERLLSRLPAGGAARVEACSAPGAALWLRSYGDVAHTRMTNVEWILSTRFRMGLPAPASRTGCKCVGADVEEHQMACPKLKRTAMTRRHDNIAGVIAHYVVLAGGVCEHERKLFCTSATKPDLSGALGHDREFHLDVTVRHPMCGSYVGVSKRQLGVARQGALQKEHKYAAVQHFAPFALETYGGVHHVARDFVSTVRKALYHGKGYAMSQRFACALAVTLQKGNVRVLCSDFVPTVIHPHEIGVDYAPLDDSDEDNSLGEDDGPLGEDASRLHGDRGEEFVAPQSQESLGEGTPQLRTLTMGDRGGTRRGPKRTLASASGPRRRVRVE